MPSPAVQLEVVAGKATGMSISVEDELLIGRHAEGAGALADDEEISRSHARVTLDGSGFCAIEDLGSTNGTFVNGLRISSPQTLSEGDTIELGATTLVVRNLPIPGGGQEPEPEPEPERRDFTVVTAQSGSEPPTEQATPATAHLAATAIPPLSLHLRIDFAASEALLLLDDSSEPVRLAFDAGAASTQNEKGGPRERRPDA
jgi:predicted component of type VI protein secretion system